MKRILTLFFALATLMVSSQTPYITAYVSGHVTVAGTNIPVAGQMVKVFLYSPDSVNNSYYTEDLYTNQDGFYAFQGSVSGTIGFMEVMTEVCDNQIQTETFSVSYNSTNTFVQDFFVCDNGNCSADFAYYPIQDLDVQFINESTGSNLSYYWDFGDGSFSGEENPVKTFAYPGMYIVTLSIISNDPDSCFSTLTDWVWVGDTMMICQSYFYAVPDSSGGLSANFYDMSSGSFHNWLWDFGDGSISNEQNPVHYYNEPGIYEVCLTITSNDNQCWDTYCTTVFIGQSTQCLAQFGWYQSGWDPTNSTEVTFYDLSYGNITNWSWSFGDGTGSSEQNPVHYYQSNGTYEVCLTVSGPDCQSTWCETIVVEELPGCVNYFSYQTAGMEVQFSGTTLTNIPAEFYWEFGDGITATGNPVTHTYMQPGVYFVTLTTVDLEQCVATSYQEIVVGDTIFYHQIYGQVYEDNLPLTSGMVMIFSDFADTNFYTPYYEMTMVDPSGVFVFPMVPNGNYKVMAIPTDGSPYLPTYYESTIFWQEASVVTAGVTQNPINISLQSIQGNVQTGNGSISGHINQSVRENLFGRIVIYLTNQDKQVMTFVQIDDNGDFIFEDLANGTYYIRPELAGVTSDYQMVVLSESNNQVSLVLTFDGNSILGNKETVAQLADIELYPNPATDKMRITYSQQDAAKVKISILDISGRELLVFEQQASRGNSSADVNISNLQKGIYLVKFDFGDGSSISKKLVKQ